VRPRRARQLAADGLVIKSPEGDVRLPAPSVLAEDVVAPWDLVLLSCKAYDLAEVMEQIAPAVGSQSVILPLLNGMRHLDLLDERFGPERVLGGFCHIASTLDEQGVVRHLNDAHLLAFGERGKAAGGRIQDIVELMTPSKINWRHSAVVVQEMWEKWVFLATLAASTCLMRASVGDIVVAGGADVLMSLLAEVQSIAEAAGHGARPEVLEKTRAQLTAAGSSLTASMLRDVERGGAVEADHILGDLLARGQASGLGIPLLRLAYLHLKAYEVRRQRQAAASR
jgi:2-dehydropantoate 2-reductase